MDKLYRDLIMASNKEPFESVHLAEFPIADETVIDKSLESKMKKAQIVSSLVLSLRRKEQIRVRQPLQRIMIPVLNDQQRSEILAVADLIKTEVNVKTIELLDDASDILVKQIKPNFKVLGPRFGKDMRFVASAISELNAKEITKIEQEGEISIDVNGNLTKLTLEDVEITSQDIEGWLVANNSGITVALDVTISEDLRKEGIAREFVNRIQNLRKDSGYEVSDTIAIKIQKDGKIETAVTDNMEYIKNETLATSLDLVEELDNGTVVEFDDVTTKLFIDKN
jgi:isoleucyl-tRNA synthetase